MSSFFHLGRYKLIIDHEYSTCTKNNGNEIYAWYFDESACKTRCDKNENCRFFFVTTSGWCALYKFCDERRAIKNAGSTSRKIEGRNILNSFFPQFFIRIMFEFYCHNFLVTNHSIVIF